MSRPARGKSYDSFPVADSSAILARVKCNIAQPGECRDVLRIQSKRLLEAEFRSHVVPSTKRTLTLSGKPRGIELHAPAGRHSFDPD